MQRVKTINCEYGAYFLRKEGEVENANKKRIACDDSDRVDRYLGEACRSCGNAGAFTDPAFPRVRSGGNMSKYARFEAFDLPVRIPETG